MSFNIILKNPISIWVKWLIHVIILNFKNKGKSLKINYLSFVYNTTVGKFCTIYENTFVSNSIIGNYVYIGPNTKISNAIIGNFCSIGPGAFISLGTHPTNMVSTFPGFYSTKKQCQVTFVSETSFAENATVTIGNDVWIGARAIIMDNVEIGDGAIIAAGAVVTKNIEPYAIVGGIPAKIIKKRFSDEKISELLKIKWWHKSDQYIKENASLFLDIDTFLKNNIKK